IVLDINTLTPGSYPSAQAVVNGTLFFAANDGVHGTELWRTDGTVSGTTLVKDISPGGFNSYLGNLTNVNGTLFFCATYGLWTSAGTAAATVIVSPIWSVNNLTDVNGTLFFTADDGVNGTELWKSDGTAAGTTLVKDIYPGQSRSYDYYGVPYDV